MKKRADYEKRELFNFDKSMLLLLIIALFIVIKTAFIPDKSFELMKDVEIVMDELTNGKELNLINSNELVEDQVIKLDKMDYNEIKKALGVKNDFCIFFEDMTGNLVKIDDINHGIGSSKIYINGIPCE